MIHGETVLHHGDRIALGTNHFFRINCPIEPELNNDSGLGSKQTKSDVDFSRAQEEVLLQNKSQKSSSPDIDSSLISFDDVNKSTSSLFSNVNNTDENALEMEMAIQKFEQEYSNSKLLNPRSNARIPSSSSSSSISKSLNKSETTDSGINANMSSSAKLRDLHFRNGLKKLKDKLLKAHSLCRDANSLCIEMNKLIRFSVTLQIPAYNLTPNREVSHSNISNSGKKNFLIN